MRASVIKLLIIAALAFSGITASTSSNAQDSGKKWSPDIPRTWDDEAMLSLEIPLAHPAASPGYIPSDYYYKMPVRPVHRSYPVYYPGKEPAEYMDWLRKQEPQIIFDASKLKTEQDWIKAGEMVFDAPVEFVSSGLLFSGVRDTAWSEKNHVPVTRDGVFPFMRYVIREKGKIELGILSCAMCHTRVMPDGTTIRGAQGNFPDDRAFGYETRLEAAQAREKEETLRGLRKFMRRSYAAPWLDNDPNGQPERMTLEEIVSALEAIPQGVCARQGSSAFYPPHIPDLIGVKDRHYLDASGLVRHRSTGDLMRYAALNQGADALNLYGEFRPKGKLPDPSTESRYSDEQLYALALYVYSLKPPPNPNKFDALAARGKEIFEREGCAACHTPPLYTNNKLTPADGFKVPDEHRRKFDVLQISVGTDPRLTLKTRRGTGYYKVPSLKGVWYRGPFEHNGSVATLEDWFDPRRLGDDYVPTGFRGYGVKTRAVKGHMFGLDLSVENRRALIAFLKTL
ncbi:MAG TPA: di-heme oxidoredictase family protein [Blastocatellia bacterium]|nr:di-heme oxidoredictase family protein [Blastocatellia bacterium]